MFSMKRFVTVGAIAASFATYSVLQPCSAKADDEGGVFGDVTVSEVAATPARAGEITIVTFSVENSGNERVLITGLRLPGGEPARIMGSFGQGHSGEIGTLPVRPGGTESLDGTKVWIEVGPLAGDLKPDMMVNARLVLGMVETPLTLHVGPVSTGSTKTIGGRGAAVTDNPLADARAGAGC